MNTTNKQTSEVLFGKWLSRLLRWVLGLLLIGIAWKYEDAQVLYFFGALVFITGFFLPKRCIDDACNIHN